MDADDDRAKEREIADAVDHLIKSGEAWVVRKDEESGLEVLRERKSSLASTNPELYGRLLQVNERLSSAGGSMCIWGMLAVLVICVGLHLHWFARVLGNAEESLRSIWFYAVAIFVAFFLSGGLARAWERVIYGHCRETVLRAIGEAKISPHRLIAVIEGDEALDNLANQLKEDSRIE